MDQGDRVVIVMVQEGTDMVGQRRDTGEGEAYCALQNGKCPLHSSDAIDRVVGSSCLGQLLGWR